MTIKPILLNADGSLPNGLTLEAAQSLGLTPVHPSARPAPAPGLQIVEGAPVQDESGVWRQQWVSAPTPHSAQISVADAWERVKAKRSEVTAGGVLVSGHWYHTDPTSKIQHLGNKDTARDMLDAGALPTDALLDPVTGNPIVWRVMSGAYVPMTIQIALDVVRAGKALELAAFAAAEVHRAALAQATNPADYDFSGGWPAVYQGG